MTSRPVPESLREQGLQPVWAAVRRQLDMHGPDRRGRVALPDLEPASELTLESLLGRVTKRLSLVRVEEAFVKLRIGDDLSQALTHLGHPPSAAAARRRAIRSRSTESRTALRDCVRAWPEPWACEWAEDLISAGLISDLDGDEVRSLVDGVRQLLDTVGLDERRPDSSGEDPIPSMQSSRQRGSPPSRTELAAALFGSSHALDQGTKLASVVMRALRCQLETSLDGRELWEAAGIGTDRVSAPALAWGVPAVGGSALAEMLRLATAAGLPVHVSLFALQMHTVTVPAGTPVLVVENPRLVEAAAERCLPGCVVAGNGNPSTAVTTLLAQMLDVGAELWYHGDFDAPGIAICRRMHDLGCKPWMMAADDYQGAVRLADRNGVQLERSVKECGPTPWDPTLETVFDEHRLILHEEFVLDEVLGRFAHIAMNHPASTDSYGRGG